jgi:hypothetical protein
MLLLFMAIIFAHLEVCIIVVNADVIEAGMYIGVQDAMVVQALLEASHVSV